MKRAKPVITSQVKRTRVAKVQRELWSAEQAAERATSRCRHVWRLQGHQMVCINCPKVRETGVRGG